MKSNNNKINKPTKKAKITTIKNLLKPEINTILQLLIT